MPCHILFVLFVILVYTLQLTSSINIISVFSRINMSKLASTNDGSANTDKNQLIEQSKTMVSESIIL